MTYQLLPAEWSPLKHQAEDVQRLARFSRVNIWNELGTGKTATTAWWLQTLWLRGVIDEVVLVLPSMTMPDWRETFDGRTWPEGLVNFIDCRPPDNDLIEDVITSGLRTEQHKLTVMATTFSGLRSLLVTKYRRKNIVKADHPMMIHARGRRIAIVVDEAQGVALSHSGQGVAARAFASACIGAAGITATPIGRPEHMRLWGLTKLVRPDVLKRLPPDIITIGKARFPAGAPGSFDAFKYRYGQLHDPMESKGKQFSVSRSFVVGVNQKRIQYEVLDPMHPYTVRRRKDECLDLPDKIYFKRSFDLPPSAAKLMLDLIEDDRAVLDDGHAIVPENVLIERLRTIELTGGYLEGRPVHSGKLALLRDVIEEIKDAHGDRAPRHIWASRSREVIAAALVAAGEEPDTALRVGGQVYGPLKEDGTTDFSRVEYQRVVELLGKRGVAIIHGPTPARQRDMIQSDWRAGRYHTVIAHPGVAGAGLNWQHSKSAVYYSQPLGTIARSQSEDRVHRHGLKHKAIIYDLVVDNGPDEAVVIAHRKQRSVALSLLNWLAETIYG